MRTNKNSRNWSKVFLPLLLTFFLLPLLFARKQQASASLITITEFSDFQCPYCKRAASVVEQVRQAYGERVKVVFKQMPLPMHKNAFEAAQASVCAADQGKFWEYHDRLFAADDMSPYALNRIALEVGLKQDEFNVCIDSDSSRAVVERDLRDARQLGISGTPTFLINGKKVVGALSSEAFKQQIDQAMLKADPGVKRISPKYEAKNLDAIAVPQNPAIQSSGLGVFAAAGQLRQAKTTATAKGVGLSSSGANIQSPAATSASGPNLSINDVTLAEDSCQNKSFVFTVTLSKLANKVVTVNYATSDGPPNQTGAAAVANKDYGPVSGTLSFTHDTAIAGPKGTYLLRFAVPLGNYVVSTGTNDGRAFTVTLSGATNATISKTRGVGTLLNAATSCAGVADNACFTSVNHCGSTESCTVTQVNLSTTTRPYCSLAGLGITPVPDPNFASCNALGLWVDSDGDGLSDAEEAQGYIDNNANGVYESGVDVPVPGADPNVPDVYLHYDYVTAADHDHNPPTNAINLVKEAFAAHGVNLHIDPNHHAIAEADAKVVTLLAKGPDYVPDPACAGPSARSLAQLRITYADVALLTPAYHYVVFGHFSSCDTAEHCLHCAQDPECGGGSPPFFASGGSAEINGNDVIVSLGFFTDHAVPIPDEFWAGVFMHELGHNFGLRHGGSDCDNYKPNYLSMMNYSFYTTGIPVGSAAGDSVAKACMTDADCGPAPLCPGADCEAPPHCSATTHLCYRLDYSSFQYNNLNESGLNEAIGLAGRPNSKDLTIWSTDGSNTLFGGTDGAPIDWNKDGLYLVSQHQDINGDASETSLVGSNDWATSNGLFTNLNFNFQCTSNFGDQIQAAAGTSLQELLQDGLFAKRTQPVRRPTARSYWPMVLPAASTAGARKISECR